MALRALTLLIYLVVCHSAQYSLRRVPFIEQTSKGIQDIIRSEFNGVLSNWDSNPKSKTDVYKQADKESTNKKSQTNQSQFIKGNNNQMVQVQTQPVSQAQSVPLSFSGSSMSNQTGYIVFQQPNGSLENISQITPQDENGNQIIILMSQPPSLQLGSKAQNSQPNIQMKLLQTGNVYPVNIHQPFSSGSSDSQNKSSNNPPKPQLYNIIIPATINSGSQSSSSNTLSNLNLSLSNNISLISPHSSPLSQIIIPQQLIILNNSNISNIISSQTTNGQTFNLYNISNNTGSNITITAQKPNDTLKTNSSVQNISQYANTKKNSSSNQNSNQIVIQQQLFLDFSKLPSDYLSGSSIQSPSSQGIQLETNGILGNNAYVAFERTPLSSPHINQSSSNFLSLDNTPGPISQVTQNILNVTQNNPIFILSREQPASQTVAAQRLLNITPQMTTQQIIIKSQQYIQNSTLIFQQCQTNFFKNDQTSTSTKQYRKCLLDFQTSLYQYYSVLTNYQDVLASFSARNGLLANRLTDIVKVLENVQQMLKSIDGIGGS